jgi:acetylornithine deacetylase
VPLAAGDDPQRFVDSVRDYADNLLLEMRQVAPEADISIAARVLPGIRGHAG